MIKVYQKYLAKSFLKMLLIVFAIFFSLVIILNIFEEVSYLKETDTNLFFPFLLTLLNSPSIVFETFPFIFFIATQFLFIRFLDREELEIFKKVSLTNFKIIFILSLTSLFISIFLIVFYYNLSSNLKFIYLELKNEYSKDNKYLAVVTENGLWIKDEINNNINIINASKIAEDKLIDVTINQFTKQYENTNNIIAKEINIKNKLWIIQRGTFSSNNDSQVKENIIFETNFNSRQIKQMFSDLTSLNFFALNKLRDDYKSLG